MDTDTSTIQRIDIEEKMRSAYLDYAMSVITARALPDVRDGLKPGQRRILYAMHDMGILHERPTRKSARIVGEVLGKYHPHGDQAVYDAMVRMAQDFAMRYPLVEGQGNFGSVDGDDAAAMRYTEARLEQIGEELLLDLAKDTVDFADNFDGSLQEPAVLPARLPNLLINGVGGIAVGMATNMPPHNLGEVVNAIAHVVDHYDNLDDVTVDDLMRHIPGPDFPTAGSIFGRDGIRQAYATGKGRITVRALAHMEELGQGKSAIIITEIPYQVNKATLVERIAKLVRDERVDGIADLRDESDRTGMRIVIELKRNVDEGPVMQTLLKYTQLQTTFGVNMLALVDGEPRTLTLKRCLIHYIDHRIEVIERRTRHDLERARARAHILEGLLIALDNLDEVIATIRRSKTAETARNNLCKKFKLSQVQATAILDMQLRRLAALERRRIQDEYKEVQARIKYLEELLGDRAKILDVIKSDALEIKKLYGDARRTALCSDDAADSDTFEVASMVPSENVFALLTHSGKIRRLPEDAYRSRRTAVPGMLASERDVVQAHVLANAQDEVCLVTNLARAFCLPAHQLPDGDQHSGGLPVGQLVRLDEDERPIALFNRKDRQDELLAMVTTRGQAKRIAPDLLSKLSRTPTSIMRLDEGEELAGAILAPEGAEALLATRQGKVIRIALATVAPKGLGAGGVRGISVQDGDGVIGMDLVRPGGCLVVATEAGYIKQTKLTEYNAQGRGGQGVSTVDTSKQAVAGDVAAMCVMTAQDELVLTASKHKMVRMTLDDIPSLGRGTWGRIVTRTRRHAVIDAAETPVAGLVLLPGLGEETTRSTQKTGTPQTRTRSTRARTSAASGTQSKKAPAGAAEPRRTRTKRTTSSDTRASSTPTEPATEPEPAPSNRRSRRSTKRRPPTRRKKS